MANDYYEKNFEYRSPIRKAYDKFEKIMHYKKQKVKVIEAYMGKAYRPDSPDGELAYWLEVEGPDAFNIVRTQWLWFTHRNKLWDQWYQAAGLANVPNDEVKGFSFLLRMYNSMMLSPATSRLVVHYNNEFNWFLAKKIQDYATLHQTFFMHQQYNREEVGIPFSLAYMCQPDIIGGHFTNDE